MGPAAHPVSLCLSLGQYKASYSRHFISPDKQERQDKEIFRQNMKRRLETFKSTKHNICSSKSKARLKEKGRKKASGPQTAAPLLAVRFGLPERSCRGWMRCCRASASPEPTGISKSPPPAPHLRPAWVPRWHGTCMGAACPRVPIMPELPHVVPSPGGAESFFSKHAQGHLGTAPGFAQGRSQPGPSRSAEGHLSDQRRTQREDAQRCPLAGGR